MVLFVLRSFRTQKRTKMEAAKKMQYAPEKSTLVRVVTLLHLSTRRKGVIRMQIQ